MLDIDPRVLAGAGQRIRVRCPFHDDSNPSAVFYPDGHFHCFACGEHARSVVDYVRKLEFPNEAYADGMRYAESLLGVRSPFVKSVAPKVPELIFPDQLTTLAMTLFCEAATGHLAEMRSAKARVVMAELTGKRGLRNPLGLGLGLANERLVAVTRQLLDELGYGEEAVTAALVKAGILKDETTRRPFSYRLGDRILIPEKEGDPSRVVYYQARTTDPPPQDPDRKQDYLKYLSPKRLSKPLYGRSSLSRHTDRVWITEGAFDMLPLLEIGESAVATMGTQLADRQLLELLGLSRARELLIAFDRDDAGQKAAQALAERLRQHRDNVAIVSPDPPYKDFGEWFAEHGTEKIVGQILFDLP